MSQRSLFVVLVLLASEGAWAQNGYTSKVIPNIYGNLQVEPQFINDKGTIVGRTGATNNPGTFILLPSKTPHIIGGGVNNITAPKGLNNRGSYIYSIEVGSFAKGSFVGNTSDFVNHALELPSNGHVAMGEGINDRGLVIGSVFINGDPSAFYTWERRGAIWNQFGKLVEVLDYSALGYNSEVYDINDSGDILGYISVQGVKKVLVHEKQLGPALLDIPSGYVLDELIPGSITNSKSILVSVRDLESMNSRQLLLYTPSSQGYSAQVLPLPSNMKTCTSVSINENSQVLATCGSDLLLDGYLYLKSDGIFEAKLIRSMIADQSLTSFRPLGINNLGQIVGIGYSVPAWASRAFLLTPQ